MGILALSVSCAVSIASAANAAQRPAKRPAAPAKAQSAGAAQNSATKRFPPASTGDESKKADSSEDTRGAARQMAREAIALMHDGRWAEAEALLARASKLVPAPTLAVLHGRTLEQLGKLTEAAERYEFASNAGSDGAPEAFKKAAEEATTRLTQLRERIPKVSIVLEGEHLDETRVVLLVDSRPIAHEDWAKPQLLNPGDHVVAASVDGNVAVEDQVMLKEGESKQVVLRLHADPRPAPAPEPPAKVPPVRPVATSSSGKTWRFVALGLGAAGLATGITAGVVMLDAKSTLDTQCMPLCPPGADGELSRFRTARVVSAVGYGVGVVGIGVGAILLLVSHQPHADERAARLRMIGSFDRVGVEGTF